jgi:dipeptidyl aminopeptidase/acylaminoacyl peptidase
MRHKLAWLSFAAASLAALSPAQTAEEVYVPSFDGTFVAAALRKPAGNGPFPAVILLHGGVGGSGFQGVKRFAAGPVPDRLLELGYVVMSADYRRYHFGEDELQDVVGAFRKLASYPFVDGKRIALIGASHGGYLAEFVATRIKPAAVISYSGGTDIEATMSNLAQKQKQKLKPGLKGYEDWLEQLLSAKRSDVEIPLELAWRFGDRHELYRDISPNRHAGKIKSPVLCIMAGKDLEASRKGAKWLVDELNKRGQPAEYAEFSGMPHVFSLGNGDIKNTPEFRESLKRTVDFLGKHVKGTAK